MAYPTKYTRQFDYQSYQNANPTRPLPADKVNADLNQVALSSRETIDFLKKSIRADGTIVGAPGTGNMNGSNNLLELTDTIIARNNLKAARKIDIYAEDYASFDGVSNVVSGINSAIAAASALGGGRVILPAKIGIVGGATIVIPSNVQLVGRRNTTLKLASYFGQDIISANTVEGIGIKDLAIDCNFLNYDIGAVAPAIRLTTVLGPTIENVDIINIGTSFAMDNSISTTSLTMGTGSKSLTVGAGLAYPTGAPIILQAGITDNVMMGTVTSYNSGTGALVVNITAYAGVGTFAAWNVGPPYARGILCDDVSRGSIRGGTIIMPNPSGMYNQSIYAAGGSDLTIDDVIIDGSATFFTGTENLRFTDSTIRNWRFGGGVTSGGNNGLFDGLNITGGRGTDSNETVPSAIEFTATKSVVSNSVIHDMDGGGIVVFGQNNKFDNLLIYDTCQKNPSDMGSAAVTALYGDATLNANHTTFSNIKAYNTAGISGPQAFGYNESDAAFVGIKLVGNDFSGNRVGEVLLSPTGDTKVSDRIIVSSASKIKTTNYTVLPDDSSLVFNGSGTITLTLPAPGSNPGRWLYLKTIAAFTVVSASSNVKPITSNSAGTAILPATSGAWASLQSEGSSWVVMSRGT
jgi:hypothetical protein